MLTYADVCRHHYQFARWGNIQTRYLCGWGGPADADGNLTYIKVLPRGLKYLFRTTNLRFCGTLVALILVEMQECQYDRRENATEAMLKRALSHLEHNLTFIGLTEEWEASIEMMSKVLPTFFEDVHPNISSQTCKAGEGEGDMRCPKPPVHDKDQYALAVIGQELAVLNDPYSDYILAQFVWCVCVCARAYVYIYLSI